MKTDKEIEEEFDKFISLNIGNVSTGHYCDILDDGGIDLLKDFIIKQRNEDREAMVKWLEGEKRKDCQELKESGTCMHFHVEDDTYNEALEEVINYLTGDKKS